MQEKTINKAEHKNLIKDYDQTYNIYFFKKYIFVT